MSFADKIKTKRNERGLSQRQLADALGVSSSLLAMYETGKRKPSFEMLCALGRYFNIRINDLVDDSEEIADGVPDAQKQVLTLDEQKMLDAYRSAEPIWRQAALDILLAHKTQ